MLPIAISSTDFICVEPGHFLMTNKFEQKKHLGTHLETHNINIFSMTLTNTNIKTVHGSQSSPILHDLSIGIAMEVPVSSIVYTGFPQIKVISHHKLALCISNDYLVCF